MLVSLSQISYFIAISVSVLDAIDFAVMVLEILGSYPFLIVESKQYMHWGFSYFIEFFFRDLSTSE